MAGPRDLGKSGCLQEHLETPQARKKSTKINFWGPETARWGGGLPREGVVAEKFALSLKSLSSLGFEGRNLGCPENFAGMSRTRGVFKKFVHFSFPTIQKRQQSRKFGENQRGTAGRRRQKKITNVTTIYDILRQVLRFQGPSTEVKIGKSEK